MALTVNIVVVVVLSMLCVDALHVFNNTFIICPPFDDIANGNSYRIASGDMLHLECNPDYDLFGPSKVTCVDGVWQMDVRPKCIPRCRPPPRVHNGDVEVDTMANNDNQYSKGALATYVCHDGFQLQPADGQYRVCEKGIWTGTNVTCTPRCKSLMDIANGYFLMERVGEQLIGRYYCKRGYKLRGQAEHRCQSDGMWTYRPLPQCVPIVSDESGCALPDSYPHATSRIVAGNRVGDMLIAGTEVEFVCAHRYRNANDPCKSARLRCVDGKWLGTSPRCEVSSECGCVPTVSVATPIVDDVVVVGGEQSCHYAIGTQVRYVCQSNYELRAGSAVLNCSASGCWSPSELPRCTLSQHRFYFDGGGGGDGESVILSLMTGAVVLLILFVICMLIVCRRRTPRTTTATNSAVASTPVATRAADLLQHPADRLALIAFADGLQSSGLPSYEEATRDRMTFVTSGRLQRPPWPALVVGRRSRPSPNLNQLSSCDLMGSTDTMAASDNSTTVTLDTASSHSGSQPASCRAHCGSLASFDTNIEGVPLLEESELEEIHCCETVSLAMENRSMCDNSSFKLSIASDLA